MPDMRGLTILVATADPARYHAALSLAAAQAALGGQAQVHLQGDASSLLDCSGDLHDLRVEAQAIGVSVTVCQTGLAGVNELSPEVEADGLVGLLSRLKDDRLLVF